MLEHVAVEQASVADAQVHAVALAVAPVVAVGTRAGLHPGAVAVRGKAVLPHVPEVVLIDVALAVVGADAWA